MGKKQNSLFLDRYMELDKVCCDKFGVATGHGVVEYIHRLSNARFAPGRDDALARLVKYSNIHKRLHRV